MHRWEIANAKACLATVASDLGVAFLFPVLNFVYWRQVYGADLLPPDGDSVAIPIFSSLFLAVFGFSPFLLFTWFCLRRYNPEARLLTLRRDRPARTVIATLVFGGSQHC